MHPPPALPSPGGPPAVTVAVQGVEEAVAESLPAGEVLGMCFAYADNFSRENGSMLGQVVVVVPWYWRAMVPSDGWYAAIMLESTGLWRLMKR